MIQLHHQPVVAVPPHEGDAAPGRRVDRRALRRHDVDPLVRPRAVQDRVPAPPRERARHVAHDGRDRRRRDQRLVPLLERVQRRVPTRGQHLRAAQHRVQIVCRRERPLALPRVELPQLAALERLRARPADPGLEHLLIQRLQPRDQPEMRILLRQRLERAPQLGHPQLDALQLGLEQRVLARQPLRGHPLALLHEEPDRERAQRREHQEHRRHGQAHDIPGQPNLTHPCRVVRHDHQRPASSSHRRPSGGWIRTRHAASRGRQRHPLRANLGLPILRGTTERDLSISRGPPYCQPRSGQERWESPRTPGAKRDEGADFSSRALVAGPPLRSSHPLIAPLWGRAPRRG